MEYLLTDAPLSWKTFDEFQALQDRSLPLLDSDRFVSYRLEDLYPEWQKRAHCKGTGLENYFGDEEAQPTMSIKQVRQASKLCDVCPVFRDCLEQAINGREEYGVWAGTSGRVRRKIFQMINAGDVTSEEVVEDICNGRRGKYTGPLGGSSGSGVRRDRPEQGDGSLRDEASG